MDLVLNAASAYGGDRSGPFGGGPLADAAPDAFDAWAAAPARAAFTFLSAASRFVVDQGRPATLDPGHRRIGAARDARPRAVGRRRLRRPRDHEAAALELREQGIHVALLIVDAGIEPFEGGGREGVDRAALADPREIADAVAFLAEQGARAATHELQVTPLAEHWVP